MQVQKIKRKYKILTLKKVHTDAEGSTVQYKNLKERANRKKKVNSHSDKILRVDLKSNPDFTVNLQIKNQEAWRPVNCY